MIDPNTIRDAARREGGVSRRLFLAHAAALSSLPMLGTRAEGRALRRPRFEADPFTLGVASGDPDARGAVLWTRLAPKPLDPGGGMPRELVTVAWEVAKDENMSEIVRKGEAIASPQLGHSVHVEVDGLEPDRPYWYRFRAGDAESPVGRTRTFPTPSALPDRLRFAFASCQHYEAGFFTAYEHMAEEDLDLVVHLGDYIYEGPARTNEVRSHIGEEIKSLDDYRIRLSLYRSDPHLAAMHSRCPWVVTWDDHEFDNNYAGDISEEEGIDPAAFLERRANAYQAYYEMMPLRKRSIPHGPRMRIYRSVPFGRLAGFQVLDTRQYRTDQPNGDRRSPLNAEALDARNTLLGDRQARWLRAQLLASTATWNVLAQQVMMGMVGFRGDDEAEPSYSMDQWPGYAADRDRLLRFLADRGVPNPVVLTGDIHANWVNDLRLDDHEPETPVVATEFVGTSITSGGDGRAESPGTDRLLAENPGVRYFNAQRGYVRCEVTPESWTSDYRVVEAVTTPGAPIATKASFVVESGRPGVQSA